MLLIEEYILRSRSDRRKHLDLSEPCIEIGGKSASFRGALALFLGTTIPSGSKIYLCHACNNERCSNMKHLYWGTPQDNSIDQYENGRKSFYHLTRDKHGSENHLKMLHKAASKGGKRNKNNILSNSHRTKLSESLKRSWANRKNK